MGGLVKRGIATGKYAFLASGKGCFYQLDWNDSEEIQWAFNNPLIELYPGEYVINIANIARNKNMVAVNNAVKVDLTGQITCESQFGPGLSTAQGDRLSFTSAPSCLREAKR